MKRKQDDPRFAGAKTSMVFSCSELGSRLRQRRKELGYTQEDVARMLSFSPRLIGDIERGKTTVGVGRILSYLHVIGADLVIQTRG